MIIDYLARQPDLSGNPNHPRMESYLRSKEIFAMENQTVTTTKQSIQEARDPRSLITPTLPADFTSSILVDAGVECVWTWLQAHAPEDIRNVFQGILWGFDVKCQAAANGGQIPANLDDPKLDWFLGAVRSMSALGFKFS